jgi:hypothetical protein
MTSAAVTATILARCLERTGPFSDALPATFFRAQARFLRDPWNMATGADFRFPDVDGVRPPLYGVSTRYMDALFASVVTDAELRQLVGEVFHMLRPPRDLFSPSVMLRVARHALAGRTRPVADGEPIPAYPST